MGAGDDAGAAGLRSLPAVHELAACLEAPHALAVAAARLAIEESRTARLAGWPGSDNLVARAREMLATLERPSLRRVINATGVILHTNLGSRAAGGRRTRGGGAGRRWLYQPRAGPGLGRAGQPPRPCRGTAV